MKSKFCSIAVITTISSCVLTLCGLIFRSTLYWKIPVASGDAYGVADIIDLLFGLGVILLSSISIFLSLGIFIIPHIRNIKLSVKLISASLLSAVMYFTLHQYIPKLVQ